MQMRQIKMFSGELGLHGKADKETAVLFRSDTNRQPTLYRPRVRISARRYVRFAERSLSNPF